MWELAKTTLYGRLLIIEPILLIALELCIPPSFSNDEIFIRNLDIFRYDGLYFFLKFCQCICTYLAAFFHLIKVLKTKQKKKKKYKNNLVHDLFNSNMAWVMFTTVIDKPKELQILPAGSWLTWILGQLFFSFQIYLFYFSSFYYIYFICSNSQCSDFSMRFNNNTNFDFFFFS